MKSLNPGRNMKNHSDTPHSLMADFYNQYHHSVFLYVYYRIKNKEEAEDISQDVFLRLMNYEQMISSDTVESFIYTIARHLVTDYLRRYYKWQEITSYLYDFLPDSTNDSESRIIADDLSQLEQHKLNLFPSRRKKVYLMHRFDEKSIPEIASELSLSLRTVENHLYRGRMAMRNFLRNCI